MATKENEDTVRHVTDAGTYVWGEGASVIAESLVTGKEPLIATEHSLHVLEIIAAARQSQASGNESICIQPLNGLWWNEYEIEFHMKRRNF
ncbi:MAG: hypothetical protein WKF87_15050 [Chryseolinea sp.]